MLQVDSRYEVWAAVIWAAVNIFRWHRSRPVLGPLLHLWWEETRLGHRHAAPLPLVAVSPSDAELRNGNIGANGLCQTFWLLA